jgi:hypothetical protein
MKRFILEFLRRGFYSFGFGPIILALLYLILYYNGVIDSLHPERVFIGMISISILAFTAGGMNAVYQIEKLRLMPAILIHGIVLYLSYLATYLVNGWLELGTGPILVFSGIFIVGYVVIWAVVYSVIRRNTVKINEIIKKKQNN